MVLQNRRKKPRSVGLLENPEAKKEAELFCKEVGSRLLPLEATMLLVPIGYNICKNRRVKFQKRRSEITGEMEYFLPREKLEMVTVFQYAMYKGRKYYLVSSSSYPNFSRIVWGGFCANFDAKELIAPSYSLK